MNGSHTRRCVPVCQRGGKGERQGYGAVEGEVSSETTFVGAFVDADAAAIAILRCSLLKASTVR